MDVSSDNGIMEGKLDAAYIWCSIVSNADFVVGCYDLPDIEPKD